MTRPDKFVVIQLGKNSPHYKVFGTWYGGYAGSDHWKMNSGIKEIKIDKKIIQFVGHSGSCYECNIVTYGTSMYSQGVLDNLTKRAKEDMGVDIIVMDKDTNWKELLKK